jgi:hypothetical protein
MRHFVKLLMIASTAMALPAAAQVRQDDPAKIRGAIYVPAGAYNAPQTWKNFDAEEVDRDLGYAQKIHVNALRTWASYEYWKQDPAKFQANFDQYLAIAKKHGIRILISLFENDGQQPTAANMWSTDPATAASVQSPGIAIAGGPEAGWGEPRKFLTWFMQRYGNDERLLAIEVMNEPREGKKGKGGSLNFAKGMLKDAVALRGKVPLTMGTARLGQAKTLLPLGIDVIEIHQNFPADTAQIKKEIEAAMAAGKEAGKPVWLTEWQRTRPGGSGFGEGINLAERGPDYASLAPTVNAYPVGTYFWSLMVKTAYLPGQRKKGTVNGLFWPDGSVVSLKDARAIAGDPKLQLKEKAIPASFGMEAVNKGGAKGAGEAGDE